MLERYAFFKKDEYSWQFYLSRLRLSWSDDTQSDLEVIITRSDLADPVHLISKIKMTLILIRPSRTLGHNSQSSDIYHLDRKTARILWAC